MIKPVTAASSGSRQEFFTDAPGDGCIGKTTEGKTMQEQKPRRVKAKITRVVTEIAIITLDRQGNVDEYIELVEELECGEISEVHDVHTVLSYHD
jgi:hypothetical protein